MKSDTALLDEIMGKLGDADQKALSLISKDAYADTADMAWVPNPGPQTEAYYCLADELYFGGEVGGGKSDLLLGLATTLHTRSLILRRLNDDARGLAERMSDIVGHDNGLNRTLLSWPLGDRWIDFGGCQLESDKHRYKGKPHDLIGFDEGSDFSFTMYEFITIWNRSADPDQRCRIVIASNPPLTAEGLWLNLRFSAWLDPKHPNPAEPGELRWYLRLNDEDDVEREVDGPGPHIVVRKNIEKEVRATSRTFIRSQLNDNPDYAKTGYGDRLENLTGDLRDNYAGGSFAVGLQDADNQVIPTSWVMEAQSRWEPTPPFNIPMTTMGVDASGGGKDPMIVAPRYDWWFDKLIETPGRALPMDQLGKISTGIIVANRRDSALVVLDMGGGYGTATYGHLKDNQIETYPYNGTMGSTSRTADRQIGFFNKRAEAHWKFREALDPDQDGGSPIALPPDQILLADLTSATFKVTPRGYQIEAKEEIIKRLNRSPDRGDAVIMAWYGGSSTIGGQRMKPRSATVQVNTKRTHRRQVINRRNRR